MDNKNPDGLRYPSIDELTKVIHSKYQLAYAAAKRAKIIQHDDYTSVENPKCSKAVGLALEEILENKVEIEFENTDK